VASYIDDTLIKDEKVIYAGNISLWSQLPLILLGLIMLPLGLILLPLFGLGLLFLLLAFIQCKTTELAFTNKRVIAKIGFISRKTTELNIAKIESMQVNQDILGRIFNFGTLVIGGAGNPQVPIVGISNPMTFRRSFMEYQDRVRQG